MRHGHCAEKAPVTFSQAQATQLSEKVQGKLQGSDRNVNQMSILTGNCCTFPKTVVHSDSLYYILTGNSSRLQNGSNSCFSQQIRHALPSKQLFLARYMPAG